MRAPCRSHVLSSLLVDLDLKMILQVILFLFCDIILKVCTRCNGNIYLNKIDLSILVIFLSKSYRINAYLYIHYRCVIISNKTHTLIRRQWCLVYIDFSSRIPFPKIICLTVFVAITILFASTNLQCDSSCRLKNIMYSCTYPGCYCRNGRPNLDHEKGKW